MADGEEIYSDHCGSCHNGGLKGFMAGAPKIGDEEDWSEYFLNGVDMAKTKVFSGSDDHKGMGKEANLTEAQVGASVDYIVSKTKTVNQ